MKNYKKALLALSIIAALPLMAATEDETIYVTTFEDQDGEDASKCSLREAITAAAQNKPYGGCPAGKTSSSVTDIIQLEAGEYILNKSLTPGSMVNIFGKTATSWDEKDVITGDYPERLALETLIKGKNSFSLFDTTKGKATLTLNNIVLTDGHAPQTNGENGGRGGAIKSGGSVNLNRVEIKNSTADIEGGAIYLSGIGSSLSIANSVLQNNNAPQGAVLAMSCLDNLKFTERTLTFANSSFVNNGSASSGSILNFCGYPSAEFNTNTIARNTAHPTEGVILKFTADSIPADGQPPIIPIPLYRNALLSNLSSLSMTSNTIVDNTALTTLLYDNIGRKTLSYNILAYNNGLSCRHLLLGGAGPNETSNITLHSNGLIKSATQTQNGYCELPPYVILNDKSTIDLSLKSQSNLMRYAEASKFTAFMPMYFLINAKDNPLVDIDTDSGRGCGSTDQRGVTRLTERVLLLDGENENSCEIGSTELVKLAASDLTNSNTSQVVILNNYEAERDFFKDLVENPDTRQEFLKYYQIRKEEFDKKIEDFKAERRYRQIYFDIFASSIPHENEENIQHFDDIGLYTVEVEALGTGQDVFVSNKPEDLPKEQDPNLKCEWDTNFQQVLMYRTDGRTTQLADFGYCKYTISLTDDPTIKTTGVLQAVFTNIAPIAKNHSYTMKWGTDQRVKLDLLGPDHYNDDGDGDSTSEYFPEGKKITCSVLVNSTWSSICKEEPTSIAAPIKLGTIDSNLVIEAQYQAPCPDESRTMCYGGDIYIKPKNNFNKFNYSFTYQVFDAEGALSNTAVVRLISSATNEDDTRKGSSGGGGSMGIVSLFALTGLAFLRRRKI